MAAGRLSDSGTWEVLESPELLSEVLRRLTAEDVARCACVNRQWRLCAKEVAKPSHWIVQMQPPPGDSYYFPEPLEVENLWMYDLDAGRERLVPIRIQPEWECVPVSRRESTERGEILCSYRGLLVIRLSYGCGYQVIIGDPLKNRWFRVHDVPFTVWSAAIWPGTSPLLVVCNSQGRVATYCFEKKCWTLGDEVDFSCGQLVRSGDALYLNAYKYGLLRLRPAKGNMRWEKVEAWMLPGKRNGELEKLDDELRWLSFFEHTEGSGEVMPAVYVEKWNLLYGTDEPFEHIRGAHAVYEAQGGKLVRSAWFDYDVSSQFGRRLETALGGNWYKQVYSFMGSPDALFWYLVVEEALIVVVYDRLEKRWKEAIVEEHNDSFVKHWRVFYFVASTSSEPALDYLRLML